jgi:nucleoid-associated protein YgaU
LGGATSATTHLQSYLYANNKPISQASGDQVLALKKLTLTGGMLVTEYDVTVAEAVYVGWDLPVQASDLRLLADGSVDRAATARAIAARAYQGWSDLSATAQDKVAAYVQEQLPATFVLDGPLPLRTRLRLHGFIQLMDTSYAKLTQVTDYSLRQIGADGIPGGTVQTHQVRAGDTLQGLAAMYFGSPAYWYLIADANGLTGNEALAEGSTITIPNQVANSANSAETFKVYNESEIVGSTSPEIRTIKKKKKWYQKLIQILIVVIMIVVIMIVAAVITAPWPCKCSTHWVVASSACWAPWPPVRR